MNDERLDDLLRALPPAPDKWLAAAFEVPRFAEDLDADTADGDDAVGEPEPDDGGAWSAGFDDEPPGGGNVLDEEASNDGSEDPFD